MLEPSVRNPYVGGQVGYKLKDSKKQMSGNSFLKEIRWFFFIPLFFPMQNYFFSPRKPGALKKVHRTIL